MIGQQIGKYRITRQIGRGGMGTVYAAFDDVLQREVAIKILNPGLEDPTVARRFQTEAIAVARLNHPGIAAIYELFEHDERQLMVMEFVRGETLEAVLARGPIPLERAVSIVLQLLDALAHAHGLGVVHRDLKPANLLLTPDGGVKITDFGIARVAGSEQLTAAGFMMGTPAYMAPEQVMGRPVDGRTDLYTVALVLFQMLTGELPFRRGTAMQVAQARIRDTPRLLGELRPDLPAWVAAVLEVALRKEPEVRFQTAVAFRDALQEGVDGRPVDVVRHPVMDTLALAGERLDVSAASGESASGEPDGPDAATVRTHAGGWARPQEDSARPAGPARARPLIAIGVVVAVLALAGGAWWTFRSGSGSPVPADESSDVRAESDVPDTAAPALAVETDAPAAAEVPGGEPSSPPPAVMGGDSAAGTVPAGPPVEPLPAPNAAAPAAPRSVTYRGVRGFLVDGRRVEERPAGLTIADDRVSLIDERGATVFVTLPSDSITSAAYTRAKNPRWYPTLAGPASDVDLPGGFFRGTYHWLALQSRDGYIIVRMNDRDWERITASVRDLLGLEIHELRP